MIAAAIADPFADVVYAGYTNLTETDLNITVGAPSSTPTILVLHPITYILAMHE